MKKINARVLAVAMSAVALVGTVGLTASPAAAATKCKTSTEEFPTSGFNADVKVKLCHQRNYGGPGGSNAYDLAYATVTWSEAGSNKFDQFAVQVRVEKNDVSVKSNVCDITSRINGSASGSYTCTGTTVVNKFPDTADGTVTYNLNDDGLGKQLWQLGGTAKM